MANLDYLKIGNYIKKTVTGGYSGNTQVNVVEINELKVNKKTAWVNGVKYEIGGKKLYNDGGVLVTTLSEIDEQFEAKIKNEFNTELGKLEDTLHYLFGLVDGAKCAENLIATEHMLRIIKEANKKIKL